MQYSILLGTVTCQEKVLDKRFEIKYDSKRSLEGTLMIVGTQKHERKPECPKGQPASFVTGGNACVMTVENIDGHAKEVPRM